MCVNQTDEHVLKLLKAGGFQLSADDVVDIASKYCGQSLPRFPYEITGVTVYKGMCEERKLGSLILMTVMKGSKVPITDDDDPYWFHNVIATNLTRDEDEFEYRDIPFDIKDEAIKFVVDALKEYGFSEKDLEDRWVTITGFNVR